jgi:ribonucleoside-diphosphate reductase alpha chain
MSEIFVEKRDGSKEPLDLEKIHKVLGWAVEGIKGVSVSEIELRSQLQFFAGIKSKEIHETLTKTAADLISEETPNYQYVASKLVSFNLRKEVYGQPEPWHLLKLVERNIGLGFYTSELLEWYSKEEWEKMNKMIKHDRDYNIVYAGMGQWLGKYLIQNRVTKQYYETPQIAYMLIAASAFHNYPEETRLKYVKDYYDALSNFDISIPTPVLGGLRTKTKQFSSCTVISCGDSLNSINATASAIVNYVSKRAGIGLDVGRIRALGSEIRGGEAKHTGVIPFLKYFQAALKSCSQGGLRGAAATCHFPFFHYEFESLIVLKNNKGVEDNRVRQMDYSIQFNRLFFRRLLEEKNITLFSPHEVPDLLDAFYSGDNDHFEALYTKYESSKKIKMKKVISSFDMAQMFLDERINTGRIYAQFIDHSNNHGSFDATKHPITSSNLCQEITLNTKPFDSLDDTSGRIALCTLSAINFGNINKPEDFEKPCELAVRALDELLTYQDYPMIQAKLATEEFRPLGVGIINLAYFLAKNNLKYDESALPILDEYMEAMTYYLIKASNQLAKEKGACKLSHETKYGQGILPYDTAKIEVNELHPLTLKQDWETLRQDLLKFGIRNATTFAAMPAESSCQLSNATNGVESPRGYVSEKASKDGVLKQVVPEYHRLKNRYHLLWDQQSPEGYIKIMAIINRWADQSISTNISYNPKFYNGKIPLGELIKHFVMCYRYGLKTLYYSNVYDGASDSHREEKNDPKEQEVLIQEVPEESCDSCVL